MEKVEKLPNVIIEGGMKWRVLRREGSLALVEGVPLGDLGRKRFDVVQVFVDTDGMERIRVNMNYDGSKDSPTWDRAAMEGAFFESVNKAKALSRQKAREAAAEAEQRLIANAWEGLTDELRTEQAMLVDELKSLSRGKKSLPKRANEIGLRLAVLEQVFHHGKPRNE